MTEAARIPIAQIAPSDHARALVPGQVRVLAESLKAIGLRTPITVRQAVRIVGGRPTPGYEIVTGRHRWEAARSLGWTEIDAIIMEGGDDDAELWEIDENFARAELTDAQRADHHVRRERILLAKGLVRDAPRGGRPPKERGNLHAYSEKTAADLGIDPTGIRRDLRRGKNIDPDVLAEVAGTDLDKGVVLDELAATPREEQRQKLADIAERRSLVRLAPDPLNDPEAHEKQLAALMSAWNRAAAVVREEFLLRIDQPVFDRGAA